MLNVQDNAFLCRCSFHSFFTLLSLVYNTIDKSGQESPFIFGALFLRRRVNHVHVLIVSLLLCFSLFFLLIHFIVLLLFLFGFVEFRQWKSGSVELAETDIILSDDTRIKRVEIQQDNELIVHAFFGLNDHTTGVFFLVSFLTILIILEISEFIRNDEISLHAIMHDQKFVSFGSLVF